MNIIELIKAKAERDMDTDKQNSVFIDLSARELVSFIKCFLCFRAEIHYCFLVRRTEQGDRGQIWPLKKREKKTDTKRLTETKRVCEKDSNTVSKPGIILTMLVLSFCTHFVSSLVFYFGSVMLGTLTHSEISFDENP